MSITNEIPVPPSATTSPTIPITTEEHAFLHSPVASPVVKSFSAPSCTSAEDANTPSSIAFPQSLRKSVSVDSFAKSSRESFRSGRSHTSSHQNTSQNVVNGPLSPGPRLEKHSFTVRHRGESLKTAQQDSSPSESDSDRYDPHSIEGFWNSSVKIQKIHQEVQNPLVRKQGQLPLLPSRTHTSLSPLNTSNITNFPPPLTSHSSFDSKRRNSTLSSSRSRSGSLGIYVANSSARIATNSSSQSSLSLGRPIVVTVIGTSSSGKSSAIHQGLSGFGLTDPTLDSVFPHATNLPRFTRHRYQFSLGSPDPNSPLQILEVIEVEIQTTDDSLFDWPQCLPPIDGVILCYDSSIKSSYQPVEGLLKRYRSQMLPVMVLACKADLERAIQPSAASAMLKQHDAGLIEVSTVFESGREKMKQSFAYMLIAIQRQRGPLRIVDDRNPASPELPHKEPPWEKSRASNTASPLSASAQTTLLNTTIPEDPDSTGLTNPPTVPSSPVLTQLAEDSICKLDTLEALTEPSNIIPVEFEETQERVSNLDTIDDSPSSPDAIVEQPSEETKPGQTGSRRAWAYLGELLDKLLFLVVSGDDPTFITKFLLTYRRFATPRSVLLAMQKRMRQFDDPCGDPMFACFAQMRICQLLETWIHEYPHDFAVRGTIGALNALIKSIISKTHLLHYGSGFLPFLEQLSGLTDQDAAWALKVDNSDADSDDYTLDEDEDDETKVAETVNVEDSNSTTRTDSSSLAINFPTGEHRSSIPLLKAALPSHQVDRMPAYNDLSPKQHIKDLVKVAQDVLSVDSAEIAQEITRSAVKDFLIIKPRDWLHFTLVSGKKRVDDPISKFNERSNHLATWVVSLILCHERPRQRARQVEKFVDIAMKLRQMNNYSGLRAFVAGINNATDDPTMEAFKSKSPDQLKTLRSWDVLLQQSRAHRYYRMALHNSKGACIPAMEVHISDLIKAHEGNGDKNDSDPLKIHWGKYNMMGGFVATTVQCQAQCRNSTEYDFPERPFIAELLMKGPLMSIEMQKSRLKSYENEPDDYYSSAPNPSQPGLRKLFFR